MNPPPEDDEDDDGGKTLSAAYAARAREYASLFISPAARGRFFSTSISKKEIVRLLDRGS